MNTLLFISNYHVDSSWLMCDGVMKKITLEIATLKQLNFEVSYIATKGDDVYLYESNQEVWICSVCNSFYLTMNQIFQSLLKLGFIHYDFIYYRYEHISLSMLKYFSRISSNLGKVIAELPTYQEKWEPHTSLKGILSFCIKRLVNEFPFKSIDLMVTFSDHRKIYGVPAIQIENFVDVSSIPVSFKKKDSSDIRLIGVAMMTQSHGFDRVIRGLYDYYLDRSNKIKISFDIIGEGAPRKEWENMVEKLHLKDFVFFHGLKGGVELDNLFNNADIGVASLAIFRKKCNKASELKIREYCARAIPFIYSAYEPILINSDFCLKVPHDESSINIKNVLDFYKVVSTKKYKEEMRTFAEKFCTCESQIEKIFSKIKCL